MTESRSNTTRLVARMFCRPRHWFAAAVVCCVACGSAASAEVPEVVTTRDRFQIPFDFDAARLVAMGANTVELYVSQDNGPWEKVATTTPDQRSFIHQVDGDGAYAFCVRARKEDGTRVPEGPLASSLNVIVDKTPPQMMVRTKATGDGMVTVSWSIEDTRLDESSLKVEILDQTGQWKQVRVKPSAEGIEEIPAQAGNEIRLTCTDKAGQTSVVTRELPAYKPVATAQLASANQPAEIPAPVLPANATANVPAELEPTTADEVTSGQTQRTAWQAPVIAPGTSHKELLGNDANSNTMFPSAAPVPQTEQGVLSRQNLGSSGAIPKDAAWAMSITKRVNTRTFRLGYELDGVGPSGLGHVGLYITEDYGRNWFHYGNDPDAISPMDVTVPRDGVYGFSFRVISGNGFGDLPPQPGERPDVAIAVDQTMPTITMQPLGHRQGANSHQIAIRWSAYDATLPPRPIRVEYGPSPSGPWTAVAPPLPNLGEYIWDVTQPMPGAVYLRVSVTDAAGNTATDFTREPLMLDFSRPAARITGVEAIAQ